MMRRLIGPVLLSLFAMSFTPFTAKVTGNQVRLRVQANFDAPIFKELEKEEYLFVIGEKGEFYAVVPPQDLKGYVFRSYILDEMVEASKLNIRLSPSADAPIIGQLQKGQAITGTPCSNNTRWLEIDASKYCSFYIAKQYVTGAEPPISQGQLSSTFMVEERLFDQILAEEEAPLSLPESVILKTVNQPTLTLTGVVRPYTIGVRNPPGRFLLTDGERTLAFLASNEIDLNQFLGQTVEIKAIPCSNRQFAYPAYQVLTITQAE